MWLNDKFQVCESKKKGIRGLSPQSQSQQLLSFPPHMHYSSPTTAPNQYHGFMPAPPPPPLPPNYMPPTCFPLAFGNYLFLFWVPLLILELIPYILTLIHLGLIFQTP